MKDLRWLAETTAPRGFRAGAVRAGIKTEGLDFALIVSDGDCGAAVFTQSQFCAPPVILSRGHAANGRLRVIAANSGCANACTGASGLANARETVEIVAHALDVRPDEILVASTGIIGQSLPMPLIREAISPAVQSLSQNGFEDAALAILTTDTSPKQAAVAFDIDDIPVTISGMVKGAGMVAPRMATVFGFFATDATIDPVHLKEIFGRVISRTLNRATVDGDTSTNDTACILASGASGAAAIEPGTSGSARFEAALLELGQELARKMARGGEGATHLVTIRAVGARTEADAEAIALTIANSPLVKTALFGGDPNWGRIAMAAGRAGVSFDQERVDITLNGFEVMRSGQRVSFDEPALTDSLRREEIAIEVNLNQGAAEAVAWTCDLSYEYVEINAEYHT
ncbi:MAG TPA: bifunctional glutamate N-acetyltransferase/amino-acid acetyltransferase ArgJ [Armatimonadota bacterium]|nr:bifunctional glutamate N-acetyltransferase/amino-acid acetyltransferase ArgJ [Armatimonadota bacterium]